MSEGATLFEQSGAKERGWKPFRPQNPTSCYRHFAPFPRVATRRRVTDKTSPITSDRDTTLTFPAICRDLLRRKGRSPSEKNLARIHLGVTKQYATDRNRAPYSFLFVFRESLRDAAKWNPSFDLMTIHILGNDKAAYLLPRLLFL